MILGIYCYICNLMYLGYVLILVGWMFYFGNVFVMIVLLVFVLFVICF